MNLYIFFQSRPAARISPVQVTKQVSACLQAVSLHQGKFIRIAYAYLTKPRVKFSPVRFITIYSSPTLDILMLFSYKLHNFEVNHHQSFTESQNHRIVGVGRDLCGSSSPTPLPKQGHLQ